MNTLISGTNNSFNPEEAINDIRALKIPRHRRRRIWKPFMEKYNCQVICEVGVQEGKHFNLLIQHHPKVAVAVDSWIDSGIVSRNASLYSQEALDRQFDNLNKLAKENPSLKVIRKYSFEAVNDFPNNYFDFVYIDADHTYQAVLRDLQDWYPKVKKGGFLAGDDYKNVRKIKSGIKFGVIQAVNEFAKTNNLTVYEIPGDNWILIKPVFKKFIIRNDDVAFDTTLPEIKQFCQIADKYGFKIIQGIVPIGEVRKIKSARLNNEQIKALSSKLFSQNKEVLDYLLKRQDLIAVHGLWHTHKPGEEEIKTAKSILEGLGFNPTYFIPPFNEGNYPAEITGLKTSRLSMKSGERLEDYLEKGTPKADIMYLHSWRFDNDWYTFEKLDNCLKRLSSNA